MKVLTSHQSQDWYTPPYIIEMVRDVLGWIDLDPASDKVPQEWIRANRIFTKTDRWKGDGLTESWRAITVFLNPPYGKSVDGQSNQALWSGLMQAEYQLENFEQGILLINSTHGYNWYENIWTRYPCCLARERIRFIKPDGTVGGQAKRGQTFVYFGTNATRFIEVFSELGRVLLP